MAILTDVSLRNYSTMRLGGKAAYLTEVHDQNGLVEALTWAERQQLPIIMIGGGSNIIWRDEGYPGLVIVNKIMRFDVFNEDASNAYVTIGAGENWDGSVAKMVESGLSGTEALSLIPGTAGATPIQNVGAYGQEIANCLVSVEAYDMMTRSLVNIPSIECNFGYRTSRFKTTDKARFYITAVTLHLRRENLQPPFYSSLSTYLAEHQITTFTPQAIRQAVIAIRTQKLPDPSKVANCGSFFQNPIVDEGTLVQISDSYSNVPHWRLDNGMVKLSAAWLIEQAGFKDFHDAPTGMGTWPQQPLVFINEHAQTTADLLKFKQKVIEAVKTIFDVVLEQEPELLP